MTIDIGDKKNMADELYKKLEDAGISCIIDDREEYSIGAKIKDVYTLGTPYIAILGDKSENNMVEIEETKTGNKFNIDIDEIVKFLKIR